MDIRKTLAIAALALAVPAAALAAKPAHPTHPTTPANSSAPKAVMFVLHGTLSKYTAVNGQTNGAISIAVTSSNIARTTLKGANLTFVLGPKTKVVLHEGKAIADGDRGIVKVRAAKSAAGTLSTIVAFDVIDQGTPAA